MLHSRNLLFDSSLNLFSSSSGGFFLVGLTDYNFTFKLIAATMILKGISCLLLLFCRVISSQTDSNQFFDLFREVKKAFEVYVEMKIKFTY